MKKELSNIDLLLLELYRSQPDETKKEVGELILFLTGCRNEPPASYIEFIEQQEIYYLSK